MPAVNASPIDPVIDEFWSHRDSLSPADTQARERVAEALDRLDRGAARIAVVDPATDKVVVDERSRRVVLLAFRLFPLEEGQVGQFRYCDRLPLKQHYDRVRIVPGAIVRFGSYVGPGAVLMPSFVNIGAYVGEGSLVDTWATVGSCAQVGANVHISGGVGIGGVLEPAVAAPVIVEDDAFLGSRAIIVEGARVREGAKLGAGTLLTGSTRVIDASSGDELTRGEAPAWAVCVTASLPRRFPGGKFGTPCLLVIRRLAEGETPDNLQLSSIFRQHGFAS